MSQHQVYSLCHKEFVRLVFKLVLYLVKISELPLGLTMILCY